MSTIDTLLREWEDYLSRQLMFVGAKIFQREEGKVEEPTEPISVYISAGNPEVGDSEYHNTDLRTYPLNVLVKFQMTGQGYLEGEDEQHAVARQRHEIADAVMSAVKAYCQEEAPIAFKAEIAKVDMRVTKPDGMGEPDNMNRMLFLIDCYVGVSVV
jgi:hypothetical protein